MLCRKNVGMAYERVCALSEADKMSCVKVSSFPSCRRKTRLNNAAGGPSSLPASEGRNHGELMSKATRNEDDYATTETNNFR
jgi:hypothetical protein